MFSWEMPEMGGEAFAVIHKALKAPTCHWLPYINQCRASNPVTTEGWNWHRCLCDGDCRRRGQTLLKETPNIFMAIAFSIYCPPFPAHHSLNAMTERASGLGITRQPNSSVQVKNSYIQLNVMGRNDKYFFPALHLVGADGWNPTSPPDGCTLGGHSQLLLCAKTCNSLTN